MTAPGKTLYLIDGHALIFKMYYAFLRRPMINSKGVDTSILFGFTKYLLELIAREQPTHLAVAFDPPGGTFRNEMYPDYKGTRPPTPQLVIDALEPLSEIVRALRIPVLMERGFEADDVIGSLALRSAAEGFTVYMVTPDKDYGQLLSGQIIQLRPGKGGEKDERVGPVELSEKWGIASPAQMVDMLTLCGDSADNVPGVRGIGEVGAAKLIARYGSVEEIYAHLSELTPRQQAQFEEARGHIALSKALVTIKTDIPLAVTEEDLRLSPEYDPSIADLFAKYEFGSLQRYLKGHVETAPSQSGSPVKEVLTAIDPSRYEGRAAVTEQLIRDISPALKKQLEDPSLEKVGMDLKKIAKQLSGQGIALNGKWIDIELMHYLVNPERSHDLDLLIKSYLGVDLPEETATVEAPQSLFAADSDSLFGAEGNAVAEEGVDSGSLSTPGQGQGEGPDGCKLSQSDDAADVGRGRSERSERSSPEPSTSGLEAGSTAAKSLSSKPLVIMATGVEVRARKSAWTAGVTARTVEHSSSTACSIASIFRQVRRVIPRCFR